MIKFSDHAWTFRRQIVALLGIALHVKEVERIVGEEPGMNGTDQSIALCANRTLERENTSPQYQVITPGKGLPLHCWGETASIPARRYLHP